MPTFCRLTAHSLYAGKVLKRWVVVVALIFAIACAVRSFIKYTFIGLQWSSAKPRTLDFDEVIWDEHIRWWGVYSAEGALAVGYQERVRKNVPPARSFADRSGEHWQFGILKLLRGAHLPVGTSRTHRPWNLVGFDFGSVSYPDRPDPAWRQTSTRIRFPYWWIIGILLIPICVRVARSYRNQERLASGLCVNCGYDLRGGSDRCPECGEPVHPVRP
jgi:hypothetical protein